MKQDITIKASILFRAICLLILTTMIYPAFASEDNISDKDVSIVPRDKWNARSPITDRMKLNPPKFQFLTIHHTAMVNKSGQNDFRILQGTQNYHMGEKKWGDIAYHYVIGPSGRVYEGRELKYVADTSTNFDPTGHFNLCLMGNFEKQDPTEKAKEVLVRFVVERLHKISLTPDDIRLHKNVASTLCPGKNLIKWIEGEGMLKIRSLYEYEFHRQQVEGK